VTAPPGEGSTQDIIAVLEVGGSHVTSALVDRQAAQVLPGTMKRLSIDPAASAGILITTFAHAMAHAGAPANPRWVIAMPGPFDYRRGTAWFTGVGKFDALYGLDLCRLLRDAQIRPLGSVQFVNDADAFAIGEWRRVSAGADRCVAVTLGSGVGSSFLANGVPVSTGPTVPPEGHVYRLRIGDSSLEDIVSRRAILARYLSSAAPDETPDIDVRDVFERSRQGDEWATRVLDDAFHALGAALAPWLARFRATVLVVGGSMAGSWDLLQPALLRGLKAQIGPELAVLRSADPISSALVGAALSTSPRQA
jgi:glucokinase